jgi:hypothetical protein
VTGRLAFQLLAGAAMLALVFAVVVRPAIERGGWPELAFVGAVFLAVLLAERWLRGR